MERTEKVYTVGDKSYVVEVLIKPDEGFVFFDIAYSATKGGAKRNLNQPVPLKEQEPVAAVARADWQDAHGQTITQFHYDNMAGGLRPKVAPEGQVYRARRDDRTGAILAPGNSQPGTTEMISRGAWTGTIDRAYSDLWTTPGDGLQSWEKDGTFNREAALGQSDRDAEIARLKEQLDRLTRGV